MSSSSVSGKRESFATKTTVQRQLSYTITQLELQRPRKGEHMPTPVSVHVSGHQ